MASSAFECGFLGRAASSSDFYLTGSSFVFLVRVLQLGHLLEVKE